MCGKDMESRRSKVEACHAPGQEFATADDDENRGRHTDEAAAAVKHCTLGLNGFHASNFGGAVAMLLTRMATCTEHGLLNTRSNLSDRIHDGVPATTDIRKSCGRVQAPERFKLGGRELGGRLLKTRTRSALCAGAARVAWELLSTELRLRARRKATQ